MGSQLDEPLLFVIVLLAAWRVTALVAYESGPFRSLESLRRLLVRIGLGRLVSCFHCIGVWIAALMVIVVYRWQPATVVVWLAVAGAVSIIERWLGGEMTTSGDLEDE